MLRCSKIKACRLQMLPPDPLGFLMVTLTRQWRRLVEEQLATSGLTDAPPGPPVPASAWGDGVTQKELAERVGYRRLQPGATAGYSGRSRLG